MMCYWRFKSQAPGPWYLGYKTALTGSLVRMGAYNGDTTGGTIVDKAEIETRPYR